MEHIKEIQAIPSAEKKLILKYSDKEKMRSPLYLMGENPESCIHGGMLEREIADLLIDILKPQQISYPDMLTRYGKHAGFEVSTKYRYYEIQPTK